MQKQKSLWRLLHIPVLLALVLIAPASAITHGERDGEDHPNVVLLIMDVGGQPTWRCSATLLSPTIVLTAGHCTSNYPDEPFTGMRIFTESDVQNGDNTYPNAGGPNFLGDTNIVAGITSFGNNGNCAGTGGVFRTDRQDVLDFVTPFLD